MQEDKDSPSGDADVLEHGSHLGLVKHLDLRDAVADLVDLGGEADLPLVLLLHLVVYHGIETNVQTIEIYYFIKDKNCIETNTTKVKD